MTGDESSPAERLEALGGEFTLADLFSDEWMHAHTSSPSIDAFLADCDYDIQNPTDFEAVPDEEWNSHVAAHTEFPDWGAMLAQALEDYDR